MPILYVIGILLLVGVLLYIVQSLPAIDADIKRIIHIVVIVAVVLWIISLFFPTGLGHLRLERMR